MRSPIRFSASTKGFYRVDVHGDAIPGDAVPVTLARHRQLLEAQGAGHAIVADEDGKPRAVAPRAPTRAQLLERCNRAIAAEARARILAIASLERQSNDNAAIALHALKMASGDEFDAAWGRRSEIDTIRAASNAIEATIATWSAAALAKFDAADNQHWTEESQR